MDSAAVVVLLLLLLGADSHLPRTQPDARGPSSVCEEFDNNYPCPHPLCNSIARRGSNFVHCTGKCLESPGASCRLRHRLCTSLQGQPLAARKLPEALDLRQAGRAMTLFFGGDHGTGKSSSARIMGEEMFEFLDDQGDPDGLFRVDGSSYRLGGRGREPPQQRDIEEKIAQIHKDVIGQLRKCPRSVIVFDELHEVNPEVIRSLAAFTNTPYVMDAGERVSVKDATFVFVSDFGREGVTRNMTLDELQEEIMESIVFFWSESGNEERVRHMIDHVVPFLPLDSDALKQVARVQFEELRHNYKSLRDRHVADVIVDPDVRGMVYANLTRMHQFKYGRGVERAVRDGVVTPILAAVPVHRLPRTLGESVLSYLPYNFGGTQQQYYVHVTSSDENPGQVDVRTWTNKEDFCAATRATRMELKAEHLALRERCLRMSEGEAPPAPAESPQREEL